MGQRTDDAGDGGIEAVELSRDDRYELLASERRRAALSVLSDRGAPVALCDLASAVATREADGDAPAAAAVDRVAVSLHHAHLPRMADAGVIDYDTGANRVERVHAVPGRRSH